MPSLGELPDRQPLAFFFGAEVQRTLRELPEHCEDTDSFGK